MLDDRAGCARFWIEFCDQLIGCVGVVDVIVGQFLALKLFARRHAEAFFAARVERRVLMRVLAIA